MSRHDPLPSQVAELARLFPHLDLLHDPRPFENAANILRRFRAVRGDELAVVAPLSVLQHLCEDGICPLWAEMETLRPGDPRAEMTYPRPMRFVEFRRVLGVELKFCPVHPGEGD